MNRNAISESVLEDQLLHERLLAFSFADLKAFREFTIVSYERIISEAENKMEKNDLTVEMNNQLKIVDMVIGRKTMSVYSPPEY
jgi:hypothetical protein